MIRPTELSAPETLRGLVVMLSQLLNEQPTTAELEGAILAVPQIERVLRDWVSSRHLNQAHALQAATFRERYPVVSAAVASPFVQRGAR